MSVIPRQLLALLGTAAQPLELALDEVEILEGVLADVGFTIELSEDQQATIVGLSGLESMRGIGELVSAAVEGEPLDAGAVMSLSNAVVDAVAAIESLASGPSGLAQLPTPLDDAATWSAIVERLPDALLSRGVEGLAPSLSAVLAAVRVLRVDVAADGSPGRRWIDWGLLSDFMGGDVEGIAASYGWGTEDFDAREVIGLIADVAARLGVQLRRELIDMEIDSARYANSDPTLRKLALTIFRGATEDVSGAVEVALVPVPALEGDRLTPTGFLLANATTMEAGIDVELSDTWTLELGGDIEAQVLPSVELQPGEPITIDGSSAEAELEVALTGAAPDGQPWLLVGDPDGVRIDLAGARFAGRTTIGNQVTMGADVELTRLRFTTDTSAADSFLSNVLGALPIEMEADAALSWSSTNGLAFRGSSGLEVELGGDITLGPLHISDLVLSLELDDAVALIATGTISLTIASFEASIGGLGLRLELTSARSGGGGMAGGLSVTLTFQGPNRIALSLEAGAVSGSGLLEIDGDRYVGGLSVDVVSVGIDAFTIIDTSLPGNPDGFALFATLTLRFPSIPLGFGFTLNGVGGILALNRGVDAEALALGLRDGAADAVLFPEDPLRDIDILVNQLDEYFPILVANTVVGPVGEIGWGAPTIITGQLGVVISLPQQVIVVLGSLETILPDADAPILELHLDVMGALDLAEGTLLVVASLYDSRLLGVIELSGDAAVYVSAVNDPYFLLSVGGFHPGFQPPAHVPAVLEDLRRMRAEVLIGLGVTATIETYFAVTSNTVQFGGAFEIEASADFLLVTYTARGWFDFDVLLRFSPFLILADASAGVGVFANNKELFGVALSVHLEGPEPWYANGNAEFKFFGINVKFDFAVGGHAPPMLPPTSDVLSLVAAELRNPAAWSTERAAGVVAGLLLAGDDSSALIRPDDVLVVRQTVAPLDYHLARFGETTPLQEEVSLTSTTIIDGGSGEALEGLDVEDVTGWFAPAQYTVMRDEARLSAPSYEYMTAGVRIGAPGVGLPEGDRISAPAGHETEVWEPATGHTVRFESVLAARDTSELIAASAGARVAATARGAATEVSRVTVSTSTYVAVDDASGKATSEALPYAAAVTAAGRLAGMRVVPAHAARPA